LLLSAHPDWAALDVMYTIRGTVDDVGQPGLDIETGWGRINAERALGVPGPYPIAQSRGATVR
jgi:hypothetical protein